MKPDDDFLKNHLKESKPYDDWDSLQQILNVTQRRHGSPTNANEATTAEFIKAIMYTILDQLEGLQFLLQKSVTGTTARGVVDGAIAFNTEDFPVTALTALVEFKSSSKMEEAVPQCLSEMVAAHERNVQEGVVLSEIWGIATNFMQWAFLRFVPDKSTVYFYDSQPLNFVALHKKDTFTPEILKAQKAGDIMILLHFILVRCRENIATTKIDPELRTEMTERMLPSNFYSNGTHLGLEYSVWVSWGKYYKATKVHLCSRAALIRDVRKYFPEYPPDEPISAIKLRNPALWALTDDVSKCDAIVDPISTIQPGSHIVIE